MAETLTFENTTETTTIDNLSAEEQDSLEVGEAMQEAQDSRLAGKYENAQELEKAYIELEKKLGEKSKPDTEKAEPESAEPEAKTETDETETEPEVNPTAELLESLYEQATSKDGYSKETLEQLQQSKPEDLLMDFVSLDVDEEYIYFGLENSGVVIFDKINTVTHKMCSIFTKCEDVTSKIK